MATRGSAAWRMETWGTPCLPVLVKRTIAPGCRLAIEQRAVEAFAALGSVLQAHRYPVRRAWPVGDTSVYNCRPITGGSSYSSHSWGTAIDVNAGTNPYRRDRLATDMPRAMVDDVLRIRAVGGVQVWRWGGDWDGRPDTPHAAYDAMHFEVVATPEELRGGIDWSTVRQPVRDPQRPTTWPPLERGDRGPTVMVLQGMLGRTQVDGAFGAKTELRVREYQLAHGLKADGVVGASTWTALLTGQPEVQEGDPGPRKEQPPAPPLPDREPDLTPVDPGRPEMLRRVRIVEAQVRATGTPDAPSEVQRVAEALLTGAGAILEPIARTVLESLARRAREEIGVRVRTRTGVDL